MISSQVVPVGGRAVEAPLTHPRDALDSGQSKAAGPTWSEGLCVSAVCRESLGLNALQGEPAASAGTE